MKKQVIITPDWNAEGMNVDQWIGLARLVDRGFKRFCFKRGIDPNEMGRDWKTHAGRPRKTNGTI